MNGYSSSLRRILVSASILALTIFGFVPFSHADSSTTRAARLTFMQGAVTVTEPGNAPVPAQLNLPLLSGLQLSTGADGQAEIEFEDGSVVRLTPNSALSLDNLAVDPTGVFTTDLSLLHGLAYLELRSTPQYRYSLNAGGDVVSPVENTTVRVNFDQPPAAFAVLDGTAHIDRQGTGNGYQADVRAGETLSADANDPTRYFLTQGVDADSWDQWNEDMDQNAAAQSSDTTDVRNSYAGAQGYGWSDLDANGNWYNVPGTGSVWQPYAATDDSGWDPYGYGGWMSYPGVGYLWASGYPWGWTPYRCGNWSYFSTFGWGWAPGAGCGGLGWGFAGGGGRSVNIVNAPAGYRPIRVPTPGHGPQRPWMPVGSGRPPVVASRPVDNGPRQIGGATVTPVKRVGNGFNSGEPSATSALRRDFPVDSKTRTPVLGLAGTHPANVYTIPARNNHQSLPANAGTPAASAPSYGRQQSVPAGSPAQNQRPANQNAPFQRGTAQPSNGQPAVQPDHRNYIPPPASQPAPQPDHRNYTPPPSQPQHPSYTPPPSPPPQQHYSPPPPPPQPHYSPPPPPASPPPSPPASNAPSRSTSPR